MASFTLKAKQTHADFSFTSKFHTEKNSVYQLAKNPSRNVNGCAVLFLEPLGQIVETDRLSRCLSGLSYSRNVRKLMICRATQTEEKMEEGKKQHHFVLIHGACHGAWCWYKVVTGLRSEGHRVTALDMAAAGADPTHVEEVDSFSAYCRPLMEFMASLPPDETVVLVGHSMGGICISFAMEKFPKKIAAAVFVSAFMPGPDSPLPVLIEEATRQIGSYMDSRFSFTNGDDKPPTSLLFGPEFLASRLYQLSPPEDLTLATLLVRPVGFYGEPDFSEELSKDNHGSVRRFYVVCEQDNVLKQGFQELMIAKSPVDEVKLIAGADHMAMFSKSHELCCSLQVFADKCC